MAAGHDEVATAIVVGQTKLIGAVAVTLARKVPGVEVDASGATKIAGDGVAAIEALVSEYSTLTGQLGVRMCFNAAKDALAEHPEVTIPSFASLAG